MVWLHGQLYVEIIAGHDLPGERVGGMEKAGFIGRKLQAAASKLKPADAYLVMNLGESVSRLRTNIVTSHNPKWNEKFVIEVADNVEAVTFVVKDDDIVGADFIGQFVIPANDLLSGERISRTCSLTDKNGEALQRKKDARVDVEIQLTSVQQNGWQYDRGVGADGEVPFTYFPMRQGSLVTLYHDAHIPEPGPKPQVPLATGALYSERSCWDDLYADLVEAKHFVYLTGWSVCDATRLLRDNNPEQTAPTIGQLLKLKAQDEHVKVLMLVWDDKTSTAINDGIMNTMDEETRRFFANSHVHCVLVSRQGSKVDSVTRDMALTTMFSHHQKTVICDAPPLPDQSLGRMIAYVGGLDITKGRYDTPDHPLFSTLGTVHKEDFYQGCIEGVNEKMGGPRQPWHDIHSRVEGPAAWDVYTNFVNRWEKQAGKLKQLQLHHVAHSSDIFHPNSQLHGDPQAMVVEPNNPSAWNVQLLRSIDSNSDAQLPQDNAAAYKHGLRTGKGTTVDASIQSGYIHAIRAAQNFIYIENQYFLGSAHCWQGTPRPEYGCDHLVCIELALKIQQKIRARQPFCAYIVIPLFPEGVPTSDSVQAILHWQTSTFRMMYGMIADALVETGTQALPIDYLQFFFLGKREPFSPQDPAPEMMVAPDSAQAVYQRSRRHMIYVHSKMMIVDDELIIVGSANINERSMMGSRDSEIAVYCYQPFHTAATAGALPAGEVHGFRMCVWEEHLGSVQHFFKDPRFCAREVRRLADANWSMYAGEEVQPLPYGQLCSYPILVSPAGLVSARPDCPCFPDTKASVLGKKTAIPDPLTT